jgi:hypothetical protein
MQFKLIFIILNLFSMLAFAEETNLFQENYLTQSTTKFHSLQKKASNTATTFFVRWIVQPPPPPLLDTRQCADMHSVCVILVPWCRPQLH